MLAKYMHRKICLDTRIDTADISGLLTFSQSTERERERGRGGEAKGGAREREERTREKSPARKQCQRWPDGKHAPYELIMQVQTIYSHSVSPCLSLSTRRAY